MYKGLENIKSITHVHADGSETTIDFTPEELKAHFSFRNMTFWGKIGFIFSKIFGSLFWLLGGLFMIALRLLVLVVALPGLIIEFVFLTIGGYLGCLILYALYATINKIPFEQTKNLNSILIMWGGGIALVLIAFRVLYLLFGSGVSDEEV